MGVTRILDLESIELASKLKTLALPLFTLYFIY